MLTDLIQKHLATTVEFHATEEGDIDHDSTWDAKEHAEDAVMREPCHLIEDVRAKARWALADEVVQDSLMNRHIDGGYVLAVFLRSLLGDEPVDKSNNGEKSP